MTRYPHDEFDDVPEDGPRQGAHRGLRPTVRVGARELAAIVLAGVLTPVTRVVVDLTGARITEAAAVETLIRQAREGHLGHPAQQVRRRDVMQVRIAGRLMLRLAELHAQRVAEGVEEAEHRDQDGHGHGDAQDRVQRAQGTPAEPQDELIVPLPKVSGAR